MQLLLIHDSIGETVVSLFSDTSWMQSASENETPQ